MANADDWTTEDGYFTASAETFTVNVFQWLTQSAPDPTILVDDQFDQHPEISYNRMLNALTTHGFTVVRAKTSTWTSAFLADFDAVLVQFGSIDATMLTSYVHNGGGVYIVGGSGGTPIVNYNPFLVHFGLSFAFPPVDRSGNITNFVPHPVTRGVTQLYVAGPTPIIMTAPGPVILSTQFGVNWLAVFPVDSHAITTNTALGNAALSANTTGFENTAVGFDGLARNTTGYNNTASGGYALTRTTTGHNNTAMGAYALTRNTTGADNTASGHNALFFTTTGTWNTASGVNALVHNTTGDDNTAVGADALQQTLTGSGNIAVGRGAGATLTSGDNNIYLGHPGAATESDTMRLGEDQTRTFIAGIVGVPVSGSAVLIDSNGQLGIQVSSIRYKRDIQPMGAHSRGLSQLRPVIFRYKQDAQGERQYGLIAEEVAKVYPELVTRNAHGEVESLRYQALTPMLLNELQHQQRQLTALHAENGRLRAAVQQQQAQYAALAARVEQLEAAAARAATLASR